MKCKNCNNLIYYIDGGIWCPMIEDCPDIEYERDCHYFECTKNADRIRNMTDKELAKLLNEAVNYCNINENDYVLIHENGIHRTTYDCISEWLEKMEW